RLDDESRDGGEEDGEELPRRGGDAVWRGKGEDDGGRAEDDGPAQETGVRHARSCLYHLSATSRAPRDGGSDPRPRPCPRACGVPATRRLRPPVLAEFRPRFVLGVAERQGQQGGGRLRGRVVEATEAVDDARSAWGRREGGKQPVPEREEIAVVGV